MDESDSFSRLLLNQLGMLPSSNQNTPPGIMEFAEVQDIHEFIRTKAPLREILNSTHLYVNMPEPQQSQDVYRIIDIVSMPLLVPLFELLRDIPFRDIFINRSIFVKGMFISDSILAEEAEDTLRRHVEADTLRDFTYWPSIQAAFTEYIAKKLPKITPLVLAYLGLLRFKRILESDAALNSFSLVSLANHIALYQAGYIRLNNINIPIPMNFIVINNEDNATGLNIIKDKCITDLWLPSNINHRVFFQTLKQVLPDLCSLRVCRLHVDPNEINPTIILLNEFFGTGHDELTGSLPELGTPVMVRIKTTYVTFYIHTEFSQQLTQCTDSDKDTLMALIVVTDSRALTQGLIMPSAELSDSTLILARTDVLTKFRSLYTPAQVLCHRSNPGSNPYTLNFIKSTWAQEGSLYELYFDKDNTNYYFEGITDENRMKKIDNTIKGTLSSTRITLMAYVQNNLIGVYEITKVPFLDKLIVPWYNAASIIKRCQELHLFPPSINMAKLLPQAKQKAYLDLLKRKAEPHVLTAFKNKLGLLNRLGLSVHSIMISSSQQKQGYASTMMMAIMDDYYPKMLTRKFGQVSIMGIRKANTPSIMLHHKIQLILANEARSNGPSLDFFMDNESAIMFIYRTNPRAQFKLIM
jgi:hypothetical protein